MKNPLYVAGVDEAGRGALAGPVVAAAVILPEGFKPNGVRDSKSLSEKKIKTLSLYIIRHCVRFGVGLSTAREIDEKGILKATMAAMHRALSALDWKMGRSGPTSTLQRVLVDGPIFQPYLDVPYQCIIKGDETECVISAASILAKEARDQYMIRLHPEFPMYQWESNKGYGTLQHRQVIQQLGLSPYHRKSFKIKNPFSGGPKKKDL